MTEKGLTCDFIRTCLNWFLKHDYHSTLWFLLVKCHLGCIFLSFIIFASRHTNVQCWECDVLQSYGTFDA